METKKPTIFSIFTKLQLNQHQRDALRDSWRDKCISNIPSVAIVFWLDITKLILIPFLGIRINITGREDGGCSGGGWWGWGGGGGAVRGNVSSHFNKFIMFALK